MQAQAFSTLPNASVHCLQFKINHGIQCYNVNGASSDGEAFQLHPLDPPPTSVHQENTTSLYPVKNKFFATKYVFPSFYADIFHDHSIHPNIFLKACFCFSRVTFLRCCTFASSALMVWSLGTRFAASVRSRSASSSSFLIARAMARRYRAFAARVI